MSVYSENQINLYLTHIGIPTSDARARARDEPLQFLTTLMHHHMARVPFESLSLHYSRHRTLSLDPDDLFDKIVTRGRGGYCMEVNEFFATVLRSLGYTLFSVGGRVCMGGVYGGWNHMLNILTINNTRYAVDVGFGSNGPSHPTPLEHNHEFTTFAPTRGKLEYRSLAIHTDPAQRVWVYSTQSSPNTAWSDMYAFVEIEFFPADFEVMNLRPMTAPTSFFVQTVMCMRTILDEASKKPKGLLILHRDYVKRRVGEQVEILATLKTEGDRVEALREWFGVVLSEQEKRAIRGLASELKGVGGHT